MIKKQFQQGYVLISALVFGTVFGILTMSLVGYILVQNKNNKIKEAQSVAFHLAESGLGYYRWFLAHNPGDYQHGTGNPGPYVEEVHDPEGGLVGSFSLSVEPNLVCGEATSIEIRSTGIPANSSHITRTIAGRYARPSVAEYSYIINSNVWAGDDRVIRGRYHSNGGIRMDGSNDSIVTSAQSQWLCTSSFGCSSNTLQPGVFGAGLNHTFWQYPVPPVDFVGITLDLLNIKQRASSQGISLNPVGGQSNHRGYQLVFRDNGTVDIFRVRQTTEVWGFSIENGWQRENHIISDRQFIQNSVIPTGCGLIFVEDKVWIEGVVSGKVTVAAAKPQQPNFRSDVVISGNITYATGSGVDGLTVIAENSIIIPLNSPNNLEINGIFIAQNGSFIRNHYVTSGSNAVPNSFSSFVTRNRMDINGTVVSNGRVGTKWICGGVFCSGYDIREDSYDRRLATDPPPLTPSVSDEYRFVEWRDER
jgi:hypothetical protein